MKNIVWSLVVIIASCAAFIVGVSIESKRRDAEAFEYVQANARQMAAFKASVEEAKHKWESQLADIQKSHAQQIDAFAKENLRLVEDQVVKVVLESKYLPPATPAATTSKPEKSK